MSHDSGTADPATPQQAGFLTIDEQRQVVESVRAQVRDLLHPRYNTYFNILRWCQSCDFSVSKTTHVLAKHLRFRRDRLLDEEDESKWRLQDCPISTNYATWSIVGRNRPNGDRLIVVDQGGAIDIDGVMKSVQPTQYLHHKLRLLERILRALNEMEAELGRQCFVYFVFDLQGLGFSPSLLSVVAGPFRITWQELAHHHRNWIDKFICVNAPSFINALWAVLQPFVPDGFKDRVAFTYGDPAAELAELADPSCLPERFGGKLADQKTLHDPQPVPKQLYWRPRADYPRPDQLHKLSVPASKTRTVEFRVTEPTDAKAYVTNESDIVISVFYTTSVKDEPGEDELDVIQPELTRPGMPAMDLFDFHMRDPGRYIVRFTNSASWLLPSTVRLLVHDGSDKPLPVHNMKRLKWLTPGKA